MVSLNDIAKLAGVSKSTVSRYLNNGSVSEKTKEKLQKIIEETGYQPNVYAQSLKAERTHLIGVVIPRFRSPSTNDALKVMDRMAYDNNLQLVIMNSDLKSNRTLENIRQLERQRVDVIVLFATQMTEELKEAVSNSKTPIIVVGQQFEDVTSYIYDDYDAGRQMARYADELGHRHFLFVGVSETDQAVGIERKKGFYDYFKDRDVQIDFVETSFSREEAYQKALKFLPNLKATYIVAATDHIALGILNACRSLKLNVPDDVSLSGFGGYDEAQYVVPSITTVNYNFAQMGQWVMKRVLDLGEETSSELVVKPVYLTKGTSTKRVN
ncbi:LacI family DNA-binding transcriptional regulator [Dolosicoccus paucivorans]|uniref:LacI family DNA-binding transcriptional regulator n=1 Tax=Dolosicoccus paucivorans TaxID=84521 RepID=UPI00088CD730|nr:LacI family DNA-binding transcriptional regulator [Dolosicoccus paucivorans]SDI35010.1 transcriptional regulator, LacI family [Dolosicoccus paucivorans]